MADHFHRLDKIEVGCGPVWPLRRQGTSCMIEASGLESAANSIKECRRPITLIERNGYGLAQWNE
jgi:hypothetical protein